MSGMVSLETRMMIHTVRLNLSGVVEEDFESIRRLRTDAEVRQYLGGPVAEDKISSAFSAMLKSEAKVFRWAVREKTDGSFLGLVGLGRHHDGVDTEVSYELLPEWWGNGYATEAVRAVIDHALCELGLVKS